MSRARWLGLLAVALGSGLFAYWNAGQRVTLDLGVLTLYRISLVALIFGAFLLGMVTMFLIGLRHDLRVRRQLRERGLLDARPRSRRPDEEPHVPQWGPPS